jgi:hypothetical protein
MGVKFGLKLRDEQRHSLYEKDVINLNVSQKLSLQTTT